MRARVLWHSVTVLHGEKPQSSVPWPTVTGDQRGLVLSLVSHILASTSALMVSTIASVRCVAAQARATAADGRGVLAPLGIDTGRRIADA
jgi:hypothetical protein